MRTRHALVWVLVFVTLGVAGSGLVSSRDGSGREAATGPGARLEGTVVRVVDGDTVHVQVAGRREKVRYIGIDTPETHKPGTPVQCFGRLASAENAHLVAGRRVELRTDAETRDRYGRLLAYVYRRPDGLFVNAELVRRGFAAILTISPNVTHADELLRLERDARVAGRGLWAACR